MELSEPLIVEAIYMYERENAELHHTDRFELVHEEEPTPVLRRGQEFSLAIRFNREYVEETDIVRLLFSFGANASVFKGTRGIEQVKPKQHGPLDLEAWGVRMVGNTDTDLMVEARSPVDSPVGIWQLNVETTTLGSRQPPNTFHYEKDIYLLFNPWVKVQGTRAERLTLYRAVRSIPSAKRAYAGGEQVVEDVDFKLVDLDRVDIGDPFTILIDIDNKSEEKRTVKVVLSAGSVYYNGVKAHQIKRAEGEFVLEPSEKRSLQLRCTVEEYLDKLVEYANMKLYAIATVQETNQTWADEDDFQVIKPTIKVEVKNKKFHCPIIYSMK
ncbi:hemocyte protein-glutamine gamma-glutamyltransferase-like [Fopius arisanus]|uniref:Hemocyte protein-glutamine gamma-glutamyltransferase-like n=1 Tax=Fopius arisanus TaxID=64838 RepID=A0A9R1TR35_9HYME|nr:PREDICTED: hemocyte protein-glutamine gamma-glutamyltransferase-like [Fopius arisanus]